MCGLSRVTGIFKGRTTTVIWEDGKLSAKNPDDLGQVVVWLAGSTADGLEGHPGRGPPQGPTTTTKHLRNPLSVVFILRKVMDEFLSAEGGPPRAAGSAARGDALRRKKMGPIDQRGGIFRIKYHRDGRPFYESTGSQKEGDAKRFLRLREGDLERGIRMIPRG